MTGIVLGGSGGLGSALIQKLQSDHPHLKILSPPRDSEFYNDLFWEELTQGVQIDFFINAIGILGQSNRPEKSVRSIQFESLIETFKTNTFINAIAMKHLKKNLTRKIPSLFVSLSAKLGSSDDNKLGGWYSYRASKAALNMILKTLSIRFAF